MKRLIGITVLTIILLSMCMISCRTVKEVAKTETLIDSAAIVERDSLIEANKEITARYEAVKRENEFGGITFNNPPDSIPCPENEVKIHADGSMEAKGNIRSALKTKEKTEKLTVDWQSRYDSLAQVKSKSDTKVIQKTFTTTKYVERGLPFWYIVLIGVICFIIGCMFWYKYGWKIVKQ